MAFLGKYQHDKKERRRKVGRNEKLRKEHKKDDGVQDAGTWRLEGQFEIMWLGMGSCGRSCKNCNENRLKDGKYIDQLSDHNLDRRNLRHEIY